MMATTTLKWAFGAISPHHLLCNFYGRTLSDASMLYFADVFFKYFFWPP